MATKTKDVLDELQGDLTKLTKLRAKYQEAQALAADFKFQENLLREQILFGLKSKGLKSLKNAALTVSVKERKTIRVVNEGSAVKWLDKNGYDVAEYLSLNEDRVKALVTSTGELIDGVQAEVNEFISVSANKEAKGEK